MYVCMFVCMSGAFVCVWRVDKYNIKSRGEFINRIRLCIFHKNIKSYISYRIYIKMKSNSSFCTKKHYVIILYIGYIITNYGNVNIIY